MKRGTSIRAYYRVVFQYPPSKKCRTKACIPVITQVPAEFCSRLHALCVNRLPQRGDLIYQEKWASFACNDFATFIANKCFDVSTLTHRNTTDG